MKRNIPVFVIYKFQVLFIKYSLRRGSRRRNIFRSHLKEFVVIITSFKQIYVGFFFKIYSVRGRDGEKEGRWRLTCLVLTEDISRMSSRRVHSNDGKEGGGE